MVSSEILEKLLAGGETREEAVDEALGDGDAEDVRGIWPEGFRE